MNVDEIKMGISGIIYPLLRNLEYNEIKDEISHIRELNFVSYITNPDLQTDEKLEFTEVTDRFPLAVRDNTINIEELTKRIASLRYDEAMGISSLVNTARGMMHIGMIDFLTEGGNIEKAIKTIKDISEQGFIIRSSNAYNTHHFYSTKGLQTEAEFREFMRKLKTQDSIGPNWPNLQLSQDYGLLRISTSEHKKSIPYIFTHIKP
jgi:hypothetical protein